MATFTSHFTNPVYGGALQITSGISGDLPITGTLSSSSNRFKAQYSGSRLYILNPSGTNAGIGFNGSYIHYHDNSTELNFNTPNQTYKNTNSQNTNFFSGGSKRMKINGSTTPSLELYETNGSTIHSQFGKGTTFPSSGMGEWSGFNVPIGNSIYYGGVVGEGCLLAMNGDTAMISNPGDNQSFWYYDEDGRGAKWYITVAGVITPASDIRIKTDIKTYKNSNFEKFKKLRTITYKFKKPKNISPERLLKQGCINKYADEHYGVIAQELQAVLPKAINTFTIDGIEYLGISMTELIPFNTSAIKDVDERVIELEAKIVSLEANNLSLLNLITTMNDRITALETV